MRSRPFYFFSLSEHIVTDPLDGKFVSSKFPNNEESVNEDAVSLRRFAGQYWFVELSGGEHKELSTEEIADTIKDGNTIKSIRGPFATRKEAAQSLERYWEMLMDKGDD